MNADKHRQNGYLHFIKINLKGDVTSRANYLKNQREPVYSVKMYFLDFR